MPRLVRALKRDGYIIQDGFLKSVLPEEIHLAEQENEFTTLLEKFGFEITKGHYKQAVNAHIRGDWAGANGQLRTCIESLFDTIAEKLIEEPEKLPATSDNKLTLLAQVNPPFLLQNLNEWEPSGKGFIQGFRKLLHPVNTDRTFLKISD